MTIHFNIQIPPSPDDMSDAELDERFLEIQKTIRWYKEQIEEEIPGAEVDIEW